MAKKKFELENPADLLMSKATIKAQEETQELESKTEALLDNGKELKTKRVGLIMRQTTLERAKEQAWKKHLSLNEYITQLIEGDQV